MSRRKTKGRSRHFVEDPEVQAHQEMLAARWNEKMRKRKTCPEEARMFDGLMRAQEEERERERMAEEERIRRMRVERARRAEEARAASMKKLDEAVSREMEKWGVSPSPQKVVHVHINLSGGSFSILGASIGRIPLHYPHSNLNMPNPYARPRYTDESYFTKWPATTGGLASLGRRAETSRAKHNRRKPLSLKPPKRVKLPRQKCGNRRQRYGAPHNSKRK